MALSIPLNWFSSVKTRSLPTLSVEYDLHPWLTDIPAPLFYFQSRHTLLLFQPICLRQHSFFLPGLLCVNVREKIHAVVWVCLKPALIALPLSFLPLALCSSLYIFLLFPHFLLHTCLKAINLKDVFHTLLFFLGGVSERIKKGCASTIKRHIFQHILQCLEQAQKATHAENVKSPPLASKNLQSMIWLTVTTAFICT